MKKLKNKKIIFIICILVVLLLLVFVNNIENIQKIISDNIQRQEETEELQTISFMVYDNKDINTIKAVITINSEEGIEYAKFPNGQVIQANNNKKLSLDYEIEKDKELNFIVKEANKEEETHTIYIDNEYLNNTSIELATLKDELGYKIFEVTNKRQDDGYTKTYYKIGENGTWVEGSGKVPVLDYNIMSDNLSNSDGTVTIYAKTTNPTLSHDIIVSQNYNIYSTINGSILQGISEIRSDGIQTVEIVGNTNKGKIKKQIHSLDVILYQGDLILDGENEIEGATLKDKIYEFGSKDDVATENEYAKNTVVLKVEGNLTIDSGVTLTSVRSDDGYGGPKGMIIYVTGTLKNNGTISMTERGAKAEGENVYLFKNRSGSYEYIPYSGADGGSVAGSYASGIYGWTGNTGKAATGRETGGGRFRRSLDCWMEHDCFWKRCKWYFIFWRNRRRTEVLMELKDMMEMTLVELVVQEMVLQ